MAPKTSHGQSSVDGVEAGGTFNSEGQGSDPDGVLYQDVGGFIYEGCSSMYKAFARVWKPKRVTCVRWLFGTAWRLQGSGSRDVDFQSI